MYYDDYENYIRSILGYPIQMPNTYSNNLSMQYEYVTQTPRYSNEVLELYPEIYKIVNPMVCKICEANTKPITRELIDQMTEEIYLNLENEPGMSEMDTVNVRVSLPEEKKSRNEARTSGVKSPIKSNNEQNRMQEKREKREDIVTGRENRENRQTRRNSTLQDLIKILILNQLLGGNMRPPRPVPPRPRPPFPGGPDLNPRPPFPGEPGPNPRPPIRPRDFYGDMQ